MFQDPGPSGTVFLTVPADLGLGPDQLNQHSKHTRVFTVSIVRVKMAPELIVLLFLWILRRRWTDLARRVVRRRCAARKQRFRFIRQILQAQELLLVPKIERRTLYWRRQPRCIWKMPHSANWWENIFLRTFKCQNWLENFRMHKDTFMYLCNQLKCALNKTDTRMRRAIPVKKLVAVAIWRLATNEENRTIGHLFGISRSTAYVIVHDMCSVINPRRACAARVTVLGLSFCLSVWTRYSGSMRD